MGNNPTKEGAGGGGLALISPRAHKTNSAITPRTRGKKKGKTWDDDEWMEQAFSASGDSGTKDRYGSVGRKAGAASGAKLRRAASEKSVISSAERNGKIRREVTTTREGTGTSEEDGTKDGEETKRERSKRNLAQYYYYNPPNSARALRISNNSIPTRTRASSMEDLSNKISKSPSSATPRLRDEAPLSPRKDATDDVSPPTSPRVKSPRLAQAGSGINKLWSQSVQHLRGKTTSKRNSKEARKDEVEAGELSSSSSSTPTRIKEERREAEEGPESSSNKEESGESDTSQTPIKRTARVLVVDEASANHAPSSARGSPRASRIRSGEILSPRSLTKKTRTPPPRDSPRGSPKSPRRRRSTQDNLNIDISTMKEREAPSSPSISRTPRGAKVDDESSKISRDKAPSMTKADKKEKEMKSKKEKDRTKDTEIEIKKSARTPRRRSSSTASAESGEMYIPTDKKRKKKKKREVETTNVINREKDQEKDRNEKESEAENESGYEKDQEARQRRGTVLFFEMMSNGAAHLARN